MNYTIKHGPHNSDIEKKILAVFNSAIKSSWEDGGTGMRSSIKTRRVQDAVAGLLYPESSSNCIKSNANIMDVEYLLNGGSGQTKGLSVDNLIYEEGCPQVANGNLMSLDGAVAILMQKFNFSSLRKNKTNNWNNLDGDYRRATTLSTASCPVIFVNAWLAQSYEEKKGTSALRVENAETMESRVPPWERAAAINNNRDHIKAITGMSDEQLDAEILHLHNYYSRMVVYDVKMRLRDEHINSLGQFSKKESWMAQVIADETPVVEITISANAVKHFGLA